MAAKNTLVVPEKGMPVTWIDPASEKWFGRFIEKFLIGKFGQEGLVVHEVHDLGEKAEELGKGRWLVYLERDGEPLRDHWDEALGAAPKDFQPTMSRFSWFFLQPVA